MFGNTGVRGAEFLRRTRAAARRMKLSYKWVPERGVGSHGTLYFGDRFTVIKDLKRRLGPVFCLPCASNLVFKEDL